MSICDSGMGSKVSGDCVSIIIDDTHPLVILSNKLPWHDLNDLIIDDLRNSTPLKTWHLGRKIRTRIHLGAYLLQKMYNLTDRATEAGIKENAAYQLFCGYQVVEKWHCPDHTKIESFRTRLSPETQQKLANLLCSNAVYLGLASAADVDIDSTVQEANMTYPTDAKMLRKLGTIAFNVASAIKKFFPTMITAADLIVDIKSIASKARSYFFLPKKTSNEEKSRILSGLFDAVSEPVRRITNLCENITSMDLAALPWNVSRSITQLLTYGESYLLSAQTFINTGKAESTKRLSFHLDQVSCFNKKKAHKKYEFGRAFQLGRISNNFLFVGQSKDVRMDDKKSFIPMIEQHEELFGKNTLKSIATDKGYYSKRNIKAMLKRKIAQIGIQIPGNTQNENITSSAEELEQLSNRRAGIEPLIGHAKQGGQLGRSRMKNDRNIESSGYASISGFNLRQTIRRLLINHKKAAMVA